MSFASNASLGFIVLFAIGCSAAPDTSTVGASRAAVLAGGACVSNVDCAAGLECETEVEHGVTSSTCKEHRTSGSNGKASSGTEDGGKASSGTQDGAASSSTSPCPPGTEVEIEHGNTFCKPHGSDDADAGSTASPSPGSGSGTACTTDADCGAGLECELEHGVGSCQAHGGKGK